MPKLECCRACRYAERNLVEPLEINNPDLLVVGQAPGTDEVVKGRPFVGEAGSRLISIMERVGFNMKKVAISNTVQCLPPRNDKNRDEKPRQAEINLCSNQFLSPLIMRLQPKMIMCVGKVAYNAVIALKAKEEGSWRDIRVPQNVPHPSASITSQVREARIRNIYNELYPNNI